MGMYDTVICEYPMPKVIVAGEIYPKLDQEFQTKDLIKCLINYKITKDGKLHLRDDKFLDDTYHIGEYRDIDYHGIINIYDTIITDEKMYQLLYRIKFTDGTLVEVSPTVTNY